MSKNIFVVGLDEFNLVKLKSVPRAADYTFHALLRYEEIRGVKTYSFQELLDKAEAKLKAFTGSIDAIVGYFDFPISDMVPMLCRERGLTSASLKSVVKCEHKYWSRLEQKKSIPEKIPNFDIFDPFADNALDNISLTYPFWIKPIKSFRSFLGFKINNKQQFDESVAQIREQIEKISEPFNDLLDYLDLPETVASIPGRYCIAEEIIAGRQCTLEGYAFQGDVQIYGVVDSIRYPNSSTFSRYQYPSKLTQSEQQEMAEITKKFVKHIGYDNAPFNAEFFYDETQKKAWFLEINPRISQSHGDLFEKVDGSPHHEIMIDLALGNQPEFPYRQGKYKYAAKFLERRFEDALVAKIPSESDIEQLQQQIPDTLVDIFVKPGMRLSQLANQDSYSYEIADILLGAETQHDLLEKHRQCLEALPFEFSP
ncbi:MAG: ATP-grasp domain-containing protein [Halothece sp. Uz-M2-17]|nr:ATP-grasp domain-containing protein [Halothece sp. Uz-M2-17]